MKAIVSQDFFSQGIRHGVPCVTVDFNDVSGKDMELNDIVTEIMEFRGKVDYVQVKAVLKNITDAISLIRVISETNFRVVVETNTTDDISFFISNKRVQFSMLFVQPDTAENHFCHTSLNALREWDEILIDSKDKAVIDFAVKALREKCFTRPTLVFKIPKTTNQLVMSKKFTCAIRVIN